MVNGDGAHVCFCRLIIEARSELLEVASSEHQRSVIAIRRLDRHRREDVQHQYALSIIRSGKNVKGAFWRN